MHKIIRHVEMAFEREFLATGKIPYHGIAEASVFNFFREFGHPMTEVYSGREVLKNAPEAIEINGIPFFCAPIGATPGEYRLYHDQPNPTWRDAAPGLTLNVNEEIKL